MTETERANTYAARIIALRARAGKAERELADARQERDAYMESYDGACRERDEARNQLRINVDAQKADPIYTRLYEAERELAEARAELDNHEVNCAKREAKLSAVEALVERWQAKVGYPRRLADELEAILEEVKA